MTRKTVFFEGLSWFKFHNLGLALGANLKFYTSVKRVKTKSQKVLGANSYVCRSCWGKTGRGAFLPPPIRNRVKVTAFSRREQFFLGCSVSSCGHPFLNGQGIFKKSTCRHELLINNVSGRYLKGIELIRNSSCSQPFDEWPVFYYKEQLQPRILLNSLCFWITRVVGKRYHS